METPTWFGPLLSVVCYRTEGANSRIFSSAIIPRYSYLPILDFSNIISYSIIQAPLHITCLHVSASTPRSTSPSLPLPPNLINLQPSRFIHICSCRHAISKGVSRRRRPRYLLFSFPGRFHPRLSAHNRRDGKISAS